MRSVSRVRRAAETAINDCAARRPARPAREKRGLIKAARRRALALLFFPGGLFGPYSGAPNGGLTNNSDSIIDSGHHGHPRYFDRSRLHVMVYPNDECFVAFR